MPALLAIDDQLLTQALRIGGHKTKRETVNQALYESILRHRLQAFDDIPLRTEDYARAAAYPNDCRKRGIQGSQVDFLICAAAQGHGLAIFTLDGDFRQYQRLLDIVLFVP